MVGRRPLGVGLVLVGTLTLTACSTQEPEPAATSELDGMLEPILGLDADPSKQPAEVRRAEELTAACMHAAGFEYHPDEAAGTGWRARPDGFGTVAFAERYGYGETIEVGDGLVPRMWEAPVESEGQQLNRQYVASLSPAAAQEYEVALHGEPWDPTADVDAPYVPDGCAARSYDEVSPDGFAGPADLRDVKEAVRTIHEKFVVDPRVVEATGRWSDCMADSGYPDLSEPMDAESYVATSIWSRWQDEYVDATGSPSGVSDYDVVRRTVPDALAELQAAEVAVAVADATCRDGSGYRQTLDEVETQLESEVVDTYRDDLDRWLAWAQVQRAAPTQ